MNAKRIAVGLVCAPALLAVAAGPASAGEVAGPPGPDGFATGGSTPIVNYMMHSICAFSGLNAYHPGKEGEYIRQVQNYGQIIAKYGIKNVGGGIPGDACNGHTGELAGG